MRFQPRHYTFRAVLWRGDISDLPSDWLERGRLSLEGDGTLIAETLRGPAPAEPNGQWYIREHADGVGDGELWPVRRDIFEAGYRPVQP